MSHTAFIPGRYILDNIVSAHEILHKAKVSNEKGILLRISFVGIFLYHLEIDR